MENKLELRMYGIVPYNISPIQQGIQFGHAVVEYGQMIKEGKKQQEIIYNDWANNWKTFIILNGGTSNHSINRYHQTDEPFVGSMESNLVLLEQNNVDIATFYEPDLNDMLSAIVFIVDERVFNRKKYPDFGDWVIDNYGDLLITDDPYETRRSIINKLKESTNKEDQKVYKTWVNFVGGEKNVFLIDFLRNFRLA
jgi:hypothetical protein